jgi:hypothetical protein
MTLGELLDKVRSQSATLLQATRGDIQSVSLLLVLLCAFFAALTVALCVERAKRTALVAASKKGRVRDSDSTLTTTSTGRATQRESMTQRARFTV